jgi:hypothetical protein
MMTKNYIWKGYSAFRASETKKKQNSNCGFHSWRYLHGDEDIALMITVKPAILPPED